MGIWVARHRSRGGAGKSCDTTFPNTGMTLALTVRDGDAGEGRAEGKEKENLVKLVPKIILSHFRSTLFFR